MNFTEIANNRYSCRKYDSERPVEKEKIEGDEFDAVFATDKAADAPTEQSAVVEDNAAENAQE